MSKIGFVLSHEQFRAAELLELGAAAEQGGFDTLWTSDHIHPWMDNQGHAGHAWITLAALGQRTTHIPFGTGVTCPTYRNNPAVVAHAFASLGTLYPGRVFLGVGSGEALNEVPFGRDWGDYDERSGRMVEAVELIRKLWTGEWVTHEGQFYSVRNARLYDVPEQAVPIYIAAEGPKAMHKAGFYGDGLISDSKSAIDPEFRKAFEEGAREAGKNPASLPILAEHFVTVGGQSEAEEAAKLWRFLPRAWDAYVDDPDPRSIQRRAEQDVTIEQVTEKMFISDDAQEHADSIRELFDGGVTEVYVHSGQKDQQRVLEFYSGKVLPLLRGELSRSAGA